MTFSKKNKAFQKKVVSNMIVIIFPFYYCFFSIYKLYLYRMILNYNTAVAFIDICD